MFRFPGFRSEEWMESALCAEVGGDLWFPEQHDWLTAVKAKTVCVRCPVREACLSYALRNNEIHGIWGGKSRDERKAISGASRGQERGIAG
jgi:WhiB family transcriptional regulator, redox-sensing transcriptional regulator